MTLSSVNTLDVIMVPAAGSATYTGDFIHRVTYGLEQKGFLLTSDTPVSVTIGCPDNSDQHAPDNILLRPLSADDTEFVITSFIGSSTSWYEKPQSFFSIAASEDNTNISIYNNDGDIHTTQILNVLVIFINIYSSLVSYFQLLVVFNFIYFSFLYTNQQYKILTISSYCHYYILITNMILSELLVISITIY